MSEVSIRFKPPKMDLIMWNNNLLNRFSILFFLLFRLLPIAAIFAFRFLLWLNDQWIWWSSWILCHYHYQYFDLSNAVWHFNGRCFGYNLSWTFLMTKTNSNHFVCLRINERLSGIHALSVLLNCGYDGPVGHTALLITSSPLFLFFLLSFLFFIMSRRFLLLFCRYGCCWRFCISVKAPIKIPRIQSINKWL